LGWFVDVLEGWAVCSPHISEVLDGIVDEAAPTRAAAEHKKVHKFKVCSGSRRGGGDVPEHMGCLAIVLQS
jgi:hypothetical protein